MAAFRALDKQYRHSGREDFDLLGQVEEARATACHFVAENSKQGDLDAKLVALEFIHRQTRRATNLLETKMEGLVRQAKGR